MPALQTKHYALLGAMLTSLGLFFSGLHSFADLTPMMIGGLLLSLGANITALFTGAPQKPWDGQDRRGEP